MINQYKREAFRERLQILNLLEALVTRAPDQGDYEEMLSDFGLSIRASSMEGHLREIGNNNVARFILPRPESIGILGRASSDHGHPARQTASYAGGGS